MQKRRLCAGVFVCSDTIVQMDNPSEKPQYEPGGDRIMLVIVVIVVTALGGMAWSFFSRQNAPSDAPEIKSRFLPPSERHEPQKSAVPPAPTSTPPLAR